MTSPIPVFDTNLFSFGDQVSDLQAFDLNVIPTLGQLSLKHQESKRAFNLNIARPEEQCPIVSTNDTLPESDEDSVLEEPALAKNFSTFSLFASAAKKEEALPQLKLVPSTLQKCENMVVPTILQDAPKKPVDPVLEEAMKTVNVHEQ